ncbi:hypothetical protein EMCG_00307 [[Emmonsia] crescens]|uniref:Uncharacterized protein n=1 Tax=[Emmonsia] crescens TaxID=73230 RepID=A0A0G2HXS1_9EURO|nr:hypothetical protein EMCG_00307 [Emmonsia crescens UAMH 3008]
MAVTQGHDLYDLPPEVVEKIVENLDLETIEPSSLIEQKTTDLTESSLRALCALASHPDLGPAVLHLTIMLVVYDHSEMERIVFARTQQVASNPDDGTMMAAGLRPIIVISKEEFNDQDRLVAEADLAWLGARQTEQDAQSDESIVSSLLSAFGLLGDWIVSTSTR